MPEDQKIEISYSGGTDKGRIRPQNEDSIMLCEFEHSEVKLFVVADGVGGHEGGAMASKLAVESIKNTVSKAVLQANSGGGYAENWLSHTLEQAIVEANQNITDQQMQTRFSHMATTVVALLIKDSDVVMSYLGDSRCYQFDERNMVQLTEDHTMLQKLLNEGEIDQQQFDASPMHHIINQALGLTKHPQVIVTSLPVDDTAMFLLCSDGLTNCITNAQIHYVLSNKNQLDDGVDELITRANDNGGIDNISVVLVKISRKS
ncbi:Protein serine/threonine phosphatase PrpC, regulation of stationary phase [hydrothermal vent metagenome]|uniref:Protein serine/threonine phosphatase PrpC, regulation of stationary phase n=1 Tax=hydrothermal vent metagenome TaxID=652676 RepID=A0A3B0Y2Y6_9ZZZZ